MATIQGDLELAQVIQVLTKDLYFRKDIEAVMAKVLGKKTDEI